MQAMQDDQDPAHQRALRALWDLWKLLLQLRDAADSQLLLPTQPAAWEDTVPQARDAGGGLEPPAAGL
jgi:hypothetical protein